MICAGLELRMRHRVLLPPLAAGLVLAAAACAGTRGVSQGTPDPELAEHLAAVTTPQQRLRVLFDWDMTDRDARVNGRGLLRLDGERARVDLFGPRGETLAAAVVEGATMRVVPVSADALLPPPAFLWSALGVFRPVREAALSGTTTSGDATTLAYTADGTSWTYVFAGESLQRAEWTDGTGRRTVELSGLTDHGLPREARFRDWAAFRELTLRVTEIEETSTFEADVWILPDGR